MDQVELAVAGRRLHGHVVGVEVQPTTPPRFTAVMLAIDDMPAWVGAIEPDAAWLWRDDRWRRGQVAAVSIAGRGVNAAFVPDRDGGPPPSQ